MKTAIDIDGTLSRFPMVLGWVALCLHRAGHPVWLLTGYSCDRPAEADLESLMEGRSRQLASLGLDNLIGVVPVHICVGTDKADVARLKGEFCKRENVNLFIDDMKSYCEAVRNISPTTAVLRVQP